MVFGRMCQYGNCTNTELEVTVNDENLGEYAAFCCQEHAGLFLLRRSWMIEGSRDAATAARLAEALRRDLRSQS